MNPISVTFLAVSLVAVLGGAVHGQALASNDRQYTAPVKWTEYRIASQKLTIQLPKLPVVRETSDLCSQMDRAFYQAYAAGVVYEFDWHALNPKPIPKWCTTKTIFSKAVFISRIEELKGKGFAESDETLAGIPAKVLRSISTSNGFVRTRWLVWQQDRWLELGISTREGTPVDATRFPGGLRLLNPSGQDIGTGALSTLGDADVDPKRASDGSDVKGLIIVAKPRPGYTDAARKNNVQGSVSLRVTFLGNGGIGEVSVLTALPHGLTEQAIAAARKISFLPATADGTPVTAVGQVEYSFSIY